MTLQLEFEVIDEGLYLWACRESGETLHRNGCYELGWEPWNALPNGEETYAVYFRFGSSVLKSIQAVTVSEFYQLPIPAIPVPIISNPVPMQAYHRAIKTTTNATPRVKLAFKAVQ
jgi:hypothetical protein